MRGKIMKGMLLIMSMVVGFATVSFAETRKKPMTMQEQIEKNKQEARQKHQKLMESRKGERPVGSERLDAKEKLRKQIEENKRKRAMQKK
jgi:phage FluMu protein gp41